MGAASARGLGRSVFQRPGRHQAGHRADRLGGLQRQPRGGLVVKKTYDYIHHYRGYWSDGGKCRIRIYREDTQSPW